MTEIIEKVRAIWPESEWCINCYGRIASPVGGLIVTIARRGGRRNPKIRVSCENIDWFYALEGPESEFAYMVGEVRAFCLRRALRAEAEVENG